MKTDRRMDGRLRTDGEANNTPGVKTERQIDRILESNNIFGFDFM